LNGDLSYITPVFNGADYIEEVIDSVANQRSSNGEQFTHFVINDGSTDTTAQVLEDARSRYGNHLVVVHKENGGEASAVNVGFQLAETDFVCVVNADDPLLESHGLRMLEALESAPSAVVAYPDWRMIDSEGEILDHRRTKEYDIRSLVGDFVCIPGPGAVIRTDAVPGDLRNENYRYVTDFELWLRLAGVGPFVRVPHELATWRLHDEGATAMGSGEKIANELLRLANEELQLILPPGLFQRFRRSAAAHSCYYSALQLAREDSAKARKLIAKSFATKPYPSLGYDTDHRHPVGVVMALLGPVGARLIIPLGKLRRQIRRVLKR